MFIRYKFPDGREIDFSPDVVAAFGEFPDRCGVLLKTGMWIPMCPEAVRTLRRCMERLSGSMMTGPNVQPEPPRQSPQEIRAAIFRALGRDVGN